MLQIKPAHQLHGTVEMPPSPDLFFLTAMTALASRTAVRITPRSETPLMTRWKSLMSMHGVVTEDDASTLFTPRDTAPRVAFGADDPPFRDFAVFLTLGMGGQAHFTSVSRARIEAWKHLAATLGCAVEVDTGDHGTALRLGSAEGFPPVDDLSADEVYAALGLGLGLGRRVSLQTDQPPAGPLRQLLPAFGYPITVKSSLADEKKDPLERRIRLLQKRRRVDSAPTFTLTADFTAQPTAEVAVDLPGDELLTSVVVAAKSLVQKGALIIGNALLEPWSLGVVDFIRKMGCRPALQQVRESTFGPVGMIQLQLFALGSRAMTCVPLCHCVGHLPAMVVLAAFAQGQSVFRGLEDLRRDTPDGVERLLTCVEALGARHGGMPDGLIIEGAKQFDGFDIADANAPDVNAAFAVAGLRCMGATAVNDDAIVKRWPGFAAMIGSIGESRE